MPDQESTPAVVAASPSPSKASPTPLSPPPAAAAPAPTAAPAAAPPKPTTKPPAATVEDASDSDDDAPPSSAAAKGKGKEAAAGGSGTARANASAAAAPAAAAVPPHHWQAVWSQPQNAYYFYNSQTMETTWTNPLTSATEVAPAQPAAASSTSSGGSSPPWDPSVETLPTASVATAAGGNPSGASFSYGQPSASGGVPASFSYGGVPPPQPVDPALAHLLPGSYNPLGPSGAGGGYAAQARFNTRTGRYEADPSRAPEHLGDFARMRRQNEAFFDQAEWDRQREAEFEREREAAGGSKRKRATREEVAAYKAKKEEKRKKNNSWLRS